MHGQSLSLVYTGVHVQLPLLKSSTSNPSQCLTIVVYSLTFSCNIQAGFPQCTINGGVAFNILVFGCSRGLVYFRRCV